MSIKNMELNIIKLLKKLRRQVKRKPKRIVVKLDKPKIVKKKEKIVKKHELIKTVVNGRELSLGQIAKFYNLKPHTVYARYRAGNRGKLLIRPSHRKST